MQIYQVSSTEEGVEVRVSDTGPGIPNHELGLIFERFMRGSCAKGTTWKRTGIEFIADNCAAALRETFA